MEGVGEPGGRRLGSKGICRGNGKRGYAPSLRWVGGGKRRTWFCRSAEADQWGLRNRRRETGVDGRVSRLSQVFPRECRQFKNIGLQASVSVIPAKAGTRNPVAGKYAFAANGLWIPAFAGMTVNMTTLPSTEANWLCPSPLYLGATVAMLAIWSPDAVVSHPVVDKWTTR